MQNKYIEIKGKKIPVIIRNYRKTNKIKIFYRGDILNISKPRIVSLNEVMKMIKANENSIYNQYMEMISNTNDKIRKWNNGEKLLYKGVEFEIKRQIIDTSTDFVNIYIDEDERKIIITIPQKLENEDIKHTIDKGIKDLFKNNTYAMLYQKLPYWSKITEIKYNKYSVRDAVSKFGSCNVTKKELHFSSRLIMLPEDKVDAIIVHELCHIIHANHSKDFYNLIKQYIPNYDEINKWLKQNSNKIMF